MMKRRMLTGTLALMMAVTPMATGFSFADETELNDRPQMHARGGMSEENRAEQKEKMQEIVDTYYSDISDEWSTVHEELEDTMQALREANKSGNVEKPEGRTGQGGPKNILSEYLEEGESIDDLTDSEIDDIKDALFDSLKERAGNREERIGNREERAEGRQDNKDQHQELKTAVEEEDTDTIQDILDDMLENAKERLADAKDKLADAE